MGAKIISVVFLGLLLKLVSVNSQRLTLSDETGGYSIVFAIENETPQPSENDTAELIENVKNKFETFSLKLWEASRHTFHLKSVDILIPDSWTVPNTTISTSQSYNHASIRVSPTTTHPFVESPKVCGQPGEFIELPYSMFSSSNDDGIYGLHWKMLLHLWATYRWGVHEEHGYLGDLKFPYVYRDVSKGVWEVTGCSDKPLLGSFKDLHNSAQECSPQDTLNSSSSCRFLPETAQNATTSLMHFHWIESVVNFCDENNHNRLAPNRQNSLCDHKSVWEVIRETNDFKEVKRPINDSLNLPTVSFSLVQHSPKPILYILLDQGRIEGSLTLANIIPRALINFLANPTRESTVAAIGKYPGSGAYINSTLQNAVDWTPIGPSLNKFADTVGNIYTNGSVKRDFSTAIHEAIQVVKAKGHLNGVVMLLVKFGADLDSFRNYMPESELYNELNENGIIFNSIELEINNHSGHAHLHEVASQTGGIYTIINDYGAAENSLKNVFDFLHKILDTHYADLKRDYRTLLKTSVFSQNAVRIAVPQVQSFEAHGKRIQIYFSTFEGSLGKSDFLLEGKNSTDSDLNSISNFSFRKRQDWQEQGSKWTYTLDLSSDAILSYSEIIFRSTCSTCRGTILARTNIINEVAKNVSVSVFTNKENAVVDLSAEEPLIVYVKILNSGAPVENAIVTLNIFDTVAFSSVELPLNDNGNQNPDEQSDDGIYSGYFVPNSDGKFKISVVIRGTDTLKRNLRERPQNARSWRLLPIDQGDMGCSTGVSCDLGSIPVEFMQTVEIPDEITIRGAALYIPEPSKITSFFTTVSSPEQNTAQLMWFAPSVPGSYFSVSTYDIRQSQDYASLITDFENQETITLPPGRTPAAPGSLESLTIQRPLSTTFYAIKSTYRGKSSKISDIQGIEVRDSQETTTTTASSTSTSTITTSTTTNSPTTTSSPISTDSTTSGPTTSSSPTTTSGTTTTSFPPGTDPPSTEPETPSPNDDEKPWHKRAVGIAVITISVIVAVLILVILGYVLWKWWKRSNKTGKINPPSKIAKASIPDLET